MFINGKWKLSADGVTREIFNPANNRIIAGVPFPVDKHTTYFHRLF